MERLLGKKFNICRNLAVFGSVIVLSSCAGLVNNRTFIDEMERGEDRFLVPGQHFRTVPGDSGRAYRTNKEISARTPANERHERGSRYDQSVEKELSHRLNNMTEQEYTQYRVHEQYLSGAAEKVYYLQLSPYERTEYIRLKGYNPSVTGREVQELRTGHFQRRALAHEAEQSQQHQMTRSPQSVKNKDDQARGSRDKFMGMSFYETRSAENAPIAMGMSKDEVIGRWGSPNRVDIAGNPNNENERWSFRIAGKVREVYFSSGRVEGWVLE